MNEILDSTNKEHRKLIADVSNDYEQSILEALNERNSSLKKSGNPYSTVDLIYNKFAVKCSKYTTSASKSSFEQAMEPDVLQNYMVQLSNRLSNIEEFNDTLTFFTKDSILTKFNYVLDEFNNSVMNNKSLTEVQKQIVIENAVIRFNIFHTTLKYGEEISGLSDTKSFKSWLKKQKKKIECTAKSLVAAAACTTAAVSTITGPAAIALWAVCTAQTMNAAACWSDI